MSYKANPIYINEKWEHDRYCDGEGVIHGFGTFLQHGQLVMKDRPCMYCNRIAKAKLRNQRTLEQLNGENKGHS